MAALARAGEEGFLGGGFEGFAILAGLRGVLDDQALDPGHHVLLVAGEGGAVAAARDCRVWSTDSGVRPAAWAGRADSRMGSNRVESRAGRRERMESMAASVNEGGMKGAQDRSE